MNESPSFLLKTNNAKISYALNSFPFTRGRKQKSVIIPQALKRTLFIQAERCQNSPAIAELFTASLKKPRNLSR
jgi:hypothetical protein